MSRRSRGAAPFFALLLTALCVVVAFGGTAAARTPSTAASQDATTLARTPAVAHAAEEATPENPKGSPAPPGEAPEKERPEHGEEHGGGLIGSSGRPQLLLIHGGSFLFEDPEFEPLTRGRAIAAGFVPHYVTYPLGNLPAAVDKVRAEARRLRQKFGVASVYAYGSSAGGTLAALLSGDHLVSAAVAKAPISDLTTWDWPTGRYGPEYWNWLGVDLEDRERLSPIRRPQLTPLLVIQGRADNVVPPAMNQAFAAAYNRVTLWTVAGGHTTDRVRPFLITRGMEWLARIYSRKTRAARTKARVGH